MINRSRNPYLFRKYNTKIANNKNKEKNDDFVMKNFKREEKYLIKI